MKKLLFGAFCVGLFLTIVTRKVFACNVTNPASTTGQTSIVLGGLAQNRTYTVKAKSVKDNKVIATTTFSSGGSYNRTVTLSLGVGLYTFEVSANDDLCTSNSNTEVVTQKDPSCPTGYMSHPFCNGQGICCQFKNVCIGVSCSDRCITKSGDTEILASCDDIKNKTVTTAAICPSDDKYSYKLENIAGVYTCRSVEAVKNKVFLCMGGESCDTAIGQIKTTPTGFVEAIMKLIVGVAGGVALMMLIYGGYLIVMSSGDPQKMQAAKEIITAVIVGVIMIVLSMVLLKAIGVDIFGLPSLVNPTIDSGGNGGGGGSSGVG